MQTSMLMVKLCNASIPNDLSNYTDTVKDTVKLLSSNNAREKSS